MTLYLYKEENRSDTLGIVLIVVGVLSILAIILAGLVIPLLALAHCVRSQRLKPQSRNAWVIGMLITWPFGNLIYGIWVSGDGRLRKLSILGASLHLFILSMFLVAMHFTMNALANELENGAARIERTTAESLAPDAAAGLKEKLGTLVQEMRAPFYQVSRLKKKAMAPLLLIFLEIEAADGRLSPEELSRWNELFEGRADFKASSLTGLWPRLSELFAIGGAGPGLTSPLEGRWINAAGDQFDYFAIDPETGLGRLIHRPSSGPPVTKTYGILERSTNGRDLVLGVATGDTITIYHYIFDPSMKSLKVSFPIPGGTREEIHTRPHTP